MEFWDYLLFLVQNLSVQGISKLIYKYVIRGIESAFISLAKKRGLFNKAMFSLCYAKQGGYMSIGGYKKDYHTSEVQFLPYVSGRGGRMYEIKLNSLLFQNLNDPIQIDDNYFTVVDSGTTLTYLPNKLKNTFLEHFNYFCNNNDCGITLTNGSCFHLKPNKQLNDIYSLLPSIKFSFANDIEINWLPWNYLTPDDNNKSKICIGIYGM